MTPRAGWTNDAHFWSSPWRTLAEPHIQHSHQVRDHIVVGLIRHIMFKYELAISLLDSLHVELELMQALRSQVLQIRTIQLLVDGK